MEWAINFLQWFGVGLGLILVLGLIYWGYLFIKIMKLKQEKEDLDWSMDASLEKEVGRKGK